MNFVIDRDLNITNDAGFKARVDIINILTHEFGYKYIPIKKSRKIVDIMCSFKNILEMKINKNSIILIQYPINRKALSFIFTRIKLNKSKAICMIHDIESLRNCQSDKKIKKEIEVLNKFEYIISHNSCMTKWIKDNGVKSKVYDLNLFDYVAKGREVNHSHNINEKYKVSYATGLLGDEKSSFLYKLNNNQLSNFELLLYGQIKSKLNELVLTLKNVRYMQSISPEIITEKLEGDFGLIWDGDSIDRCNGNYGYYLKYNNPHKLSMYIAAGKPVISWKKAAISNFIESNNIGFCVDSINEINDKLNSISLADYNNMCIHVKKFAEKIRKGECIKNIINQICIGK